MENELIDQLKILDEDLKTVLANQEQIYLLLRQIRDTAVLQRENA